jgi:hypothetical protein
MDNNEADLNDPGLAHAREAVAGLSRPLPPAGLAARTMARISGALPVKKVFWMLRPITHPIARIAAAALIIYTLAPLTDMEWGSHLGAQIEEHVLGSSVEDPVANFVDGVLIHYTPADSQGYQPRSSYGRPTQTKVRAPSRTRTGT